VHRSVDRWRRLALFTLVTTLAVTSSWAVASDARQRASERPTVAARVAPVARSLPRDVPPPAPAVLRLVAPSVPLTLVDAGGLLPMRAPRAATVAEALAVNGVEVGPQDQLSVAPDSIISSGDVIRVTRVADYDTVVREPVGFTVQVQNDATLPAGRVVVITPGVPGLADNTYRVRVVDGAEAGRTLVSSAVVVTPVTEIRRLGTRPAPAPADIEGIIRAAAATWGADPNQLLRVAWCESRYNPNAYNTSSGASGLFQFMPRTWAANSVRAGYGGASVFDAVANANTAAYMFAHAQAWQWSCK
jgi:hypothetical protein